MEKLLQVAAWRQIVYVIVPGGLVTSVLVALTGLATTSPESEESRLFAVFVFLVAVVCAGALIDLIGGVYEARVLDKLYPWIRERHRQRERHKDGKPHLCTPAIAERNQLRFYTRLWWVWDRYLALTPSASVLWQYYSAKVIQYQTAIRLGLGAALICPMYFAHSFFPHFWGGHPRLIFPAYAIAMIFLIVAIYALNDRRIRGAVPAVRVLNMESMNLKLECEQESDGRWLAEVPQLPGVLAYGTSANDAMSKAEALALRVLAERLEQGEAGPLAISISLQRAA